MTNPQRALIVIDAQREYFDGALPIQYPPRGESVVKIRHALDAAVSAGVPVVLVRHELPAEAPVFAAQSDTARNHSEIAAYEDRAALQLTKQYSSIFSGTSLLDWLQAADIDTVTLVGYMTNNCVVASAAAAEPLGITVEVLSDATGAIDLVNAAGNAPARQVHETLMALLHSNWAAVSTTAVWADAVSNGNPLERGDLVSSAAAGRTSA